MRMRVKRTLFLVHRWMGIALCAFFAMWFVSGVVMMYVGYPKLTPAERLRHLPPLGDGIGLLAPAQALAVAGIDGPPGQLRLAASRGGEPVYLVEPAGKSTGRPTATVVLAARSGQRLDGADAALALASAAAFAGSGRSSAGAGPAAAMPPRYRGRIDEDAFTHSRALDPHRPLHKVLLSDRDATLLYVSGQTGEVVRDATRQERLWNAVGAWIHWLYPFRGGALDRWWADIVNTLSILGIVLAFTGTVVGLMRWRFGRPYRGGARTPYAGRMMRWHHIGGLLFAGITCTWIFSGLMSMNPWRVFDSGAVLPRAQALQGAALALPADAASPAALLAQAGSHTRELRWQPVLGRLTVQAVSAGGGVRLLDGRSAQPLVLDEASLRTAARGLLDAPIERIERLTAHDFHYYDREPHTMTGASARPLPVLRVVFGDRHATWAYIDPHTGTLVARSDNHRRASRWLFALLHSWDWLPLLRQQPLWDLLLIALSAGGALLSLTGLVIGTRRLGMKLGPRPPAARNRATRAPREQGRF